MKEKSRLLIFLTLVVLATLIFSSKTPRTNGSLTFTNRMIVAFFQPFHRAWYSLQKKAGDISQNYFRLSQASQENQVLRQAIKTLTLENQSLKMDLQKFSRTESVSKDSIYMDKMLRPVAVLSYDFFSQSQTFLIGAGRNMGVTVNTVVVAPEGLVGRVIEVYDKTSKVLLLIDSYFAVDTTNSRTGLHCLVKGLQQLQLKALRIPFLSQVEFFEKGQEMQNGDMLVTSGLGGVYPGGIKVGEVVEVSIEGVYFDKALVRPAVDFAKLEEVFVLLPKETIIE